MSEPDQSPAPEPVRTVHVINGIATSVSTDGAVAMLKFMMPDGEPFALTFPVSAAVAVRTMVNDVVTQARSQDVGAGNVAPRYPNVVSVGHTDQIRGHVAVMFDPDMATAAIYMVRDSAALDVAKTMIEDVLSRATHQERARHARGLSLRDGASRLILPGRA